MYRVYTTYSWLGPQAAKSHGRCTYRPPIGSALYAGLPTSARRTKARARGDWREAGGGAADTAAGRETTPPTLDAAEGEQPTRGRSNHGTEPEREWGKEICVEGPSLSGAARKMSLDAALSR